MKQQLPIKVRVKCLDNTGMIDNFDKGVEYAWLGFQKEEDGKYWRVEDKNGMERSCLATRFQVVSESRHTGVKVQLVGKDGNAYAIMGRVVEAMKKAGVPKDVQQLYQQECIKGNYDHLLCMTLSYVDDMTYEERVKMLQKEYGIADEYDPVDSELTVSEL